MLERIVEFVPTRSHVLVRSAGIAAGMIGLSACAKPTSTYLSAVAQTWRPDAPDRTERSAILRDLVRYATLAPSSHNTQCWYFAIAHDRVSIEPDLTRRCPIVDPDDHHLFVSLGCAVENLVQAAAAYGLHASVRFDSARDGRVTVELEPARPIRSERFNAIVLRQSTRAAFDERAIELPLLRELERAAAGDGVQTLFLNTREERERISEFVVAGNTVQLGDPAFMDELRRWIRFNDADALASRDGLFSRASGNPSLPQWLGSALLGVVMRPRGDGDRYARYIRSSAGVVVFASEHNDPAHWVQTGRSFERFALQAAALDIRTAMINQAVEVPAIRERLRATLGLGTWRPDLVVRFGYGPTMPRSLRRPVTAVLRSGIIT